MKLLKPISCLLMAATFFISCETETFDTEATNFESELQSFLDDNLLTTESSIFANSSTINMSDIKDSAALQKVQNLLDDAYAITNDEKDIYIYDEEMASRIANDENLELSILETSNKASNPIVLRFTIFTGKNFTGKRHTFVLRRNKVRRFSNRFESDIVNLRRFRGGSFDRRISSVRKDYTKAGVNFRKRNDVFILASTNSDDFDDYIGAFILSKSDGTKTNIPDLDDLKFTRDGGFRDPRGIDRFFGVRKWDEKIRLLEFAAQPNQ